MTSTYKTDLGNGVAIYADEYVKTGKWVFHCGHSRLISREPLPVPIMDFEKSPKITTGEMHDLNETDKKLAKKAINDLITTPEWYKKLNYRYSVLGESSDLSSHVFGLLGDNYGKRWGFRVWQEIDYDGTSSFDITAKPYDPKTYVDHSKALQMAAKSCPIPQ
ncbi:hypothetical protein IB260_07985 [Pseudomonas sp. PDM23]|nr:hypothetical protein [Pseudomonas sp. PDM23]MBD9575242.1 hypothetical protein [Pseudomonas sp. PDM23]